MKKIKLSLVVLIALFVSATVFIACNKDSEVITSPSLKEKSNSEVESVATTEPPSKLVESTSKIGIGNLLPVKVLLEKTLLGSDIFLPIGTRWSYLNSEKSEVEFQLPIGYLFLLKDENSGTFKLSANASGYSCTCSEGSGCTTFYNADLGYGCLQSTCPGSCTGKRTKTSSKLVIEGVVSDNSSINGILKFELASLSAEGKRGFFTVPEVQNEIKRTYDIIYAHSEKPDFSGENLETIDKNKFVLAEVSLYGVEIALVVPNDSNIKNVFPALKLSPVDSGPSMCKCSGTSGSSCKFTKDCVFGYCAYSCSGCSTCTMN